MRHKRYRISNIRFIAGSSGTLRDVVERISEALFTGLTLCSSTASQMSPAFRLLSDSYMLSGHAPNTQAAAACMWHAEMLQHS